MLSPLASSAVVARDATPATCPDRCTPAQFDEIAAELTAHPPAARSAFIEYGENAADDAACYCAVGQLLRASGVCDRALSSVSETVWADEREDPRLTLVAARYGLTWTLRQIVYHANDSCRIAAPAERAATVLNALRPFVAHPTPEPTA